MQEQLEKLNDHLAHQTKELKRLTEAVQTVQETALRIEKTQTLLVQILRVAGHIEKAVNGISTVVAGVRSRLR